MYNIIVHEICFSFLHQSDATAISTLVHFNTVAAAQVVVTGNDKGAVTWHIAQPPMKTFTVLASQTAHMPHPVVCLQVSSSWN